LILSACGSHDFGNVSEPIPDANRDAYNRQARPGLLQLFPSRILEKLVLLLARWIADRIDMSMLLLGCTLAAGCQRPISTASEALVQKTTSTPAAGSPLSPGEDWPWFLGPRHNGTSSETRFESSWPKQGPATAWQKTIGSGYSAPSVLGSRLVIHHRRDDQEIVECLDSRTGATEWMTANHSQFRDPYGYNNGPRCSPILAANRCYTLGAEGFLQCLNLETGERLWAHALRQEFDIPEGFFGIAATPVLEADTLFVAVGGQPNSALVAFERTSGKLLWQAGGKSTWDGAETGWPSDPVYHWTGEEMVVSYSSPMLATFHGRRHLLCLLRQGLISVDPQTGEENFHYWFRSRAHESVNAAQPVVVGDTILLGAAYRVGSVRLQVANDGRAVKALWRQPDQLSTHWSTAIFHDGCYFGFSGRHENEAQLQCVDAATGKLRWQTSGWSRPDDLRQDADGKILDRETGQQIPWPFYGRASAILADAKLIVLAERGTLACLKADGQHWQELSRCQAPEMSYPCWTAPVFSRGLLYLRDEDSLVCLNLKHGE
jgi:outer membrane protein assembly factor BamB